ncbi:hypothetical protein TIFTF001_023258 [Ficus carica]|uniref:Uncharacterized protein n=1 Tax=Ficus carica TaxID=3494 RepID=A0AA88DK54_FICCA|nr:hypothetical protein TIFTF001_023258 [Ficus carica]
MTGHHEGETPHGLALVSQPSRLPSLAPLASQCLHTSTSLRPATTRRNHLMLLALQAQAPPKVGQTWEEDTSWFLALISKHPSLATWQLGRPPLKKSRTSLILLGTIVQF